MKVAKDLFYRGFDNVHLLRGGVREFFQAYPELVVGDEIPAHPRLGRCSLTE